jgi:hypothetical protein
MGLASTKATNLLQWIVGMGKVKFVLGFAVLALAIIAGWQIASCELANLEFHENLRDLAAQGGARIGWASFSTDEELRDAVIREANKHEIQIEPEQVTVERTGTPPSQIICLAADYKARVKLPGFSFTLHFHPSSAK